MIVDGDRSVFAALRARREQLSQGNDDGTIRPLLFFGGGLMKGVYGVGAALALEELGYGAVFTDVVGVSSGAPTAAHFVAGTTVAGKSILTNECCTRRFANPWRWWNQIDTEYFMSLMRREPPQGIDTQAILASQTRLHFGVSEYPTGKPHLITVQDDETLFAGMHASLTMQNVARHRTYIDGVHYADGGFTKPHILQTVIDRFTEATHIIFVTNNDRVFGSISWFERMLNRTLFRLRLNGPQVIAINGRREERDKALLSLWSSGIASAVVWGDGSVGSVERNPERLAAAVESSRIWWHGILS